MEKFNITDKFFEKYKLADIEFLLRMVAIKELMFQIDKLGAQASRAEYIYDSAKFFNKLKSEGFDVKGIDCAFNLCQGDCKLSFGKYDCQIEGFIEHFNSRFLIEKCSVEGMMRFVRSFPDIINLVKADIAYVKEHLPIYKELMEKKEKIERLDYMASHAILENYFNSKGYKYVMSDGEGKIYVQANLAHGRKMEFTVECSKFASDSSNILDYIEKLREVVSKEPIKIKIK